MFFLEVQEKNLLSRRANSTKTTIDVTKRGIIETLLEDLDRLRFAYSESSKINETLEETNEELTSIIKTYENNHTLEKNFEKEREELLAEIKYLKDVADKLSASFEESEKTNDELHKKLKELKELEVTPTESLATFYFKDDETKTDLELY